MTFTYKIETQPYYRETEFGIEEDGGNYTEFDYEPSYSELKEGLIQVVAVKYFNSDFDSVKKFIDDLDEIEDLALSLREELEEYFRQDALEGYYE